MNERKFEELIRNIQAMIKCPHCGSFYARENINIMGNMGEAVLVQLSCPACRMPVMATIVAKGYGDSLKGEVLPAGDFSSQGKIGPEKPIQADEIMEMHNFLENFDGNFEHLFDK